MKDLRTLCDEAIQLWDADCEMDGVISEMRAALAQPEPEGPPEDEELLEIAAKALGYKSIPSDEICTASAGKLLAYGRAVLARWGRPAIEPEELTDEALDATARAAEIQYMKEFGGLSASTPDGIHAQLQAQRLAGLRAVAARFGRPAIEPVPVSERPRERQGWCDAEERCALFSLSLIPDWPTWIIAPAAWAERFPDIYSHSLPHYALPLPTTHK